MTHLAVGHVARSQCSKSSFPHHDKFRFSIPTMKYKTTAMKATPASKSADNGPLLDEKDVYVKYLIRSCGNNADRKSERESEQSHGQKGPKRHLNNLFQENADGKQDHNCQSKKNVKLPTRYIFVLLHEFGVNITLAL
ncbi:RING/U-box superfamily protein [Striga asiatica]|uniref:RING/U-box superfamily protein n=1 Tax=Striga asiatica TaxID=4170 RepID=A0A5A7QRH5_STRAF|nr:RING/U-box superfamily protein [Striga asiatica]